MVALATAMTTAKVTLVGRGGGDTGIVAMAMAMMVLVAVSWAFHIFSSR